MKILVSVWRRKVAPNMNRQLVENLISLYSVQSINYLLPMITLPFLSRVLGPSAWGQLAFAEAYAIYVSLVIEYGFSLSATREIAQAKTNVVSRSHRVAGVMLAQLFLAGAVLLVTAVLGSVLPQIALYRSLLPLAFLVAFFRAFMPLWYFQGLERLRVVAILNASVNIVASAAILMLVRHSNDQWIPLALRAGAAAVACACALWLVRRDTPFVAPTFASAIHNLKAGFSLFLFRSAIGLYTSANVLILGIFVPATAVAFFAGAEKIAHISLSAFDPITLTFYPRISALLKEKPSQAMATARLSLLMNLGGGILAGLTLLLFAPQLVHLLLGRGYDRSIPLLRAFAVMPPIISTSIVLGVQWMLPLRLDWAYSKIILVAGVMNILLAMLLVPRYHDMGMVACVVIAEAIVSGGVVITLIKHQMDPWRSELPELVGVS